MLEGYDLSILIVRRIVLIYMIFVTMLAVDRLLSTMADVLGALAFARDLPIKSVVQVLKLALYIIATIAGVSLIIGQSPSLLLGGLGAMTAVLMLVFKDPILGLVAGVQLSTNRMLARGDWIEMPNYGADGDVLEVALTTVKVQNWDKTITTIPTYALITESFKNWRGMTESGGRRIKRAISIDMNSIRFCDQEMLDRFSRIQYITSYLGDEARGDGELEHCATRRPIGPGQQPPFDQRGHVPSLCGRLSTQPPDDSSGDDVARAAACADRARPSDRNLCLQPRLGVG